MYMYSKAPVDGTCGDPELAVRIVRVVKILSLNKGLYGTTPLSLPIHEQLKAPPQVKSDTARYCLL